MSCPAGRHVFLSEKSTCCCCCCCCTGKHPLRFNKIGQHQTIRALLNYYGHCSRLLPKLSYTISLQMVHQQRRQSRASCPIQISERVQKRISRLHHPPALRRSHQLALANFLLRPSRRPPHQLQTLPSRSMKCSSASRSKYKIRRSTLRT